MNHVQLENMQNDLWFKNNNCFSKTSQKHKFKNNFKFKTPNGMRPISVDKPSKCLTGEIDLASKF